MKSTKNPTYNPEPRDLANLALAILNQARIDWQSESSGENFYLELIHFFNSRWFEELCFLVGCHPDDLRSHLCVPTYPDNSLSDT